MPTQNLPVTSHPCAALIISSSSQENGGRRVQHHKVRAWTFWKSGKVSSPAFWHQPLILPTGTAENFTPSTSSGTQPKESQSSDLQPEFLIIRSKISSSGCPLLLAWVQLQGGIPQMLLVYCLGDGSLPRRCFSSSPVMSLLAKERSRAKHSPPFCLEKHPGKRGHMPQFEGFAWRILGVWLSPSGCLETP